MSFYGQSQYSSTSSGNQTQNPSASNLPYPAYSYQPGGQLPYSPQPPGVGFSGHPAAYQQGLGGYSQQSHNSPYPQQNTPYPQTQNTPYPQQGVGYPSASQSAPYPQAGPSFPHQSHQSAPGVTMSAPYPTQQPAGGDPMNMPRPVVPPRTHPGAAGQSAGNPPGYPQSGGQPGYPQQGGQPGYPQTGGQPGGNPPGHPQAGGQPGYPQQGGQPGYPQTGGQPGGNPPGHPQAGGQPGYPQQGGQPGYPQAGGGYPQTQPGYPQGGQPPYGAQQPPGHPTQQASPQHGGGPGYPTPQQQGYGAPPGQGPPPSGGYGGSSAPPGGAPGYPGAPSGGYGGASPQSGYNPAAPGPPPTQGGYQGAPPQGGYPGAAPPSQSGYPGAPSQFNPPPPGGHNMGAPQSGAPPAARSGRPGEYVSKVELRLECKNLLNKDVLSKSDPCAVLHRLHAGRWEEVGRTENVKNCLDPRFSRAFVMDYFFEEVQKILIAVYDIDNTTPRLDDDDFLGQVETTLGQLVSNSPFTKQLLLRNGHKAGNGTITIRAEELKEGTENVYLNFAAKKLDKKDFLGKSDPYLEVLKATADGSWQVVHRTEVVKNNLNPTWRPFELRMTTLCGGNKQQKIKFDVYDWDSDGSHDYIGGFTATVEEMMKAQTQEVSFPCINPTKKAKKKGYQNSGVVLLTSFKLIKNHTFLDFIFGGMQINFTVGIDFTGSNGHPSKPTSLHYINPQQPNEYMQAIRVVGDVCQDYDTDKMFPALGFGAKIPPGNEVLHEFAINFNPQNPYCAGIDGVLQAYYNCIQRVELYGPTNAAPIISHVANFAAAAQREEPQKGAHSYFILLMLTDGVLSDMSNTRHAIVQASKLPMSLIIVGVGNADFADMNMLDGDDGVLRSPNGEPAKRDIVQFVPFRDFKRSSSVELARCVLAEVPKQVTDYYKMRNMQPNKRPDASS